MKKPCVVKLSLEERARMVDGLSVVGRQPVAAGIELKNFYPDLSD